MREKLSAGLLKLDRIDALIQFEPVILVLGLTLAAWVSYLWLLKEVSEERHANLRRLFKNLTFHLSLFIAFTSAYFGLQYAIEEYGLPLFFERLAAYVGILVLIWGALSFVKVWRILTFEYLFLGHMKVGVPLLIVNLVALVLSVALGFYLTTEVFGLQIAPVLAGSAVVTIVMGLALQDTLGNLFSGVALQFDKPYSIGDWIEVQNGSQKWIGQVDEISWRATVLIGLSDELITIPNRIVGQAQISNFSIRGKPICRSHLFRFSHELAPDTVKSALLKAVADLREIKRYPEPVVLATEATDSYVVYKLVYFISDYGRQFIIADQAISAAMLTFEREQLKIAPTKISVITTSL